MLVLMAGLPGAGKSTLARALGRALGWPMLDKDTLKSGLLVAGVAESVAGAASYELLLRVAEALLVRQGLSTILDSPAAYPRVVLRAEGMARAAGVELRAVLCLAPREVRSRRVAEREAGPSQPRVLMEPGREAAFGFEYLPADTLAVATTRPLDELVREVLASLGQRRR